MVAGIPITCVFDKGSETGVAYAVQMGLRCVCFVLLQVLLSYLPSHAIH